MYWQNWSERLKNELGISTDPVAVTFTGATATGIPAPQNKLSVCQALKKASEGEGVTITAETCGCPGGLVNLGLGQMPAQGREKLVEFLVNKEKIYCSRMCIHRGQQTVQAPVGVASHVAFTPLSKTEVLPDLVGFVGKPGALHHLLSLINYWEGTSMKAELAGPACRTGVTYPVVTGEVGLSLFDSGARRLGHFAEDLLLVTVPFHRMIGVMHALDQGASGKHGKTSEEIERQIDELGKVTPV
jgi:uncharacterized protein (DUF169 family)